MHVGIIAEGMGDLAVLSNFLKGWLDIDQADITYLRPELRLDETDLHKMEAQHFSNWGLVLKECEEHQRLLTFLESVDEERLLVVHLDTAESHRADYPVERPEKERTDLLTYTQVLRERVRQALMQRLPETLHTRCHFAIAVEEMDAWVLTLYSTEASDTAAHQDPKKRLEMLLKKDEKLNKKRHQQPTFERYKELSRGFRKRKDIQKCLPKNASLRLFCESLPLSAEL